MTSRHFRAIFLPLLILFVAACSTATPSPTPPTADVQATVDTQVNATLSAQPVPATATTGTVPTSPPEPTDALPEPPTVTSEPEVTATEEATPTEVVDEATPTEEAEITATGESSEDETDGQPLPAEWYQDSDGNAIPDIVEIDRQYDPLVDDCARDQCSVEGAAGLSLLMQEHNTLFIFDSSGSMAAATSGGQLKIDAAKDAIRYYTRLTPDLVNLGLLVYGHRGNNSDAGRAESCAGIELLAPLGQLSPDTITDTLSLFQPTGWTPVAASLDAAHQAFVGTASDAVTKIILVSDGIETCDGDPVASAQRLFDATDIELVIDVVGFDIQSPDEVAQLQSIAAAGGGVYINAQSGADLQAYFDSLIAAEFEIYEGLACLFNTAADIRVCEEVQRSAAEVYVQNAISTARNMGQDEQVAPFEEILEQIDAGYEARAARWEALLASRDALLADLERLRQLRQDLSAQP